MSSPTEILSFWFADALSSPAAAMKRSMLWFGQHDSFDQEIRERYAELPEQAKRGELADWRGEPRSALALVLVLDQFPRNMFRDSARAFSFDAHAREAALEGLAMGFDERLHALEALFLYLPLEHAEDLQLQERAVGLFESLEKRSPIELAPLLQITADYARRHREVIRRFGRFPHRNALLARESTQEELDYLVAGGETFGTPRSGDAKPGQAGSAPK